MVLRANYDTPGVLSGGGYLHARQDSGARVLPAVDRRYQLVSTDRLVARVVTLTPSRFSFHNDGFRASSDTSVVPRIWESVLIGDRPIHGVARSKEGIRSRFLRNLCSNYVDILPD